jgi:molybdopterin-guanine dinucleotide biosynthesis protein A
LITAAILAGGRATRMGGIEKSLIVVGGERIVDRQIAVLRQVAGEILIVARDPGVFAGVDARIVADRSPGKGPIAGLEAGLLEMSGEQLILVGGDMPGLSVKVLELIASIDESFDAVVPLVDGRAEPLCARYHRRILATVQERISRDQLAMHQLINQLNVFAIKEDQLRALDPELRTLVNINAPEDLEQPRDRSGG